MTFHLKSLWKRLGRLDKIFLALLILYFVLLFAAPLSGFTTFLQFVVVVLAAWIALRFARVALRKAIWRLRNRLIVAYLLIAVVPILLILALVGLSLSMLAQQVAVYLVRSELDRRVAAMRGATDALMAPQSGSLADILRRTGQVYEQRYPSVMLLIADRGSVLRWPPDSAAISPPAPRGDTSGIVARDGRYFAWSHGIHNGTEYVAMLPLTRRYLSLMVPGLGDVYFLQAAAEPPPPKSKAGLQLSTERPRQNSITVGPQRFFMTSVGHEGPVAPFPPPLSRFDMDVSWFSSAQAADWVDAGKSEVGLLLVHTRFSALEQVILSQKADELQGLLPIALLAVAIAFLLVEMVSLVIGVSLTRTITGAVHSLYGGTQRVMHSDFSHRIKVAGRDQLGELSKSFNTMTENLERLLAVAKEKERMQAELEIAREVQEQLYPKTVPVLKTLRVTGLCQPARMVSGDYYDYLSLADNRLAIAIGDVAGKGISAALLMASIQSALRMELRACSLESARTAVNGFKLSTAHMVSELNQQLHATTSPEKFATFCFAVYDEESGMLTYTNAGHLPPILIRNGAPTRFDVNGTVVGAFPFAQYEESKIQLEPGDLLVCYTDGITEPENVYGEMFGEDRLIELIAKNAERDDTRIIETVMEAVRQWTGVPELSDDMTVVLARKA